MCVGGWMVSIGGVSYIVDTRDGRERCLIWGGDERPMGGTDVEVWSTWVEGGIDG